MPTAVYNKYLTAGSSKNIEFFNTKTMRLAQQLYEGVDIAGRGTIGVISYLRTDSTRVADEAVAMAAEYIEASYGKDYVGNTGAGKNDDKRFRMHTKQSGRQILHCRRL